MEVPRHWRIKKQRYALAGEYCPVCTSYIFPPRAVCPVCADHSRKNTATPERQPVLVMAHDMQPPIR